MKYVWLLAGILVLTNPYFPVASEKNIAVAKPGNRSAVEVGKIAKGISVHITTVGSKNAGSGTILHKQGDVYTILTAAHVLRNDKAFQITTPDGQVHKSIDNSIHRATNNVDLAIVQFRSKQNYQVAKLGNSQSLAAGMQVFVAGFPAATTTISEGTLNFTKGEITANASKANNKGYSLIYNNATLPGMSGGPVLNDRGEVVAIHGQGDRSPAGQKTGFNLGIIIERCQPLTTEIAIAPQIPVSKTPISNSSSPKADDYFLTANEKFDAGNYAGAAADYDRAIKLNAKYAEAYNNRGNLRYLYLKNPTGAMADYNRSISLRPESTLTYVNRGNLKADKFNDPRGAIADYDKSISLDDSDYLVYNNRGYLKDVKLNDIQGAMADYGRAISLNPRSVLAYNNRGNLNYHKLSNISSALADYEQAIEVDPQSPMAYYNRGDLQYFTGNSLGNSSTSRATAVQDFAMVVQLSRRGWLGIIAQGVLALDQGQAQAALNSFNQVSLEADPVDYHKYRGLAYHKLGNRKAAIAEWQKAAQLSQKLHYRKDYTILQMLMKSS
jgi:tetratricopeptide (TPR) repeat protein